MSDDVVLPPDEYLSVEEITQLRELLLTRAADLLTESRDTVHQLTEVREHDNDPLDQAASESNRGFDLRMADRDRQMVRKIRAALARMDEGEYGACDTCGDAIGFRRLLARPVATQCIDCKTSAEQVEGRRWNF